MKLTHLLPALGACLLLAACTTTQERAPADVALAYDCESGAVIQASHPSVNNARITYQGVSHDLVIAVSASGARYVGATLEWWTKGSGPGSTGLLLEHLADGTSGDTLETCTAR